MGWRLLLQIHDEVILEGPAATAERAMARVKALMARPTPEIAREMMVELAVDAKVCHCMIQPLVELYGGCMVVLKVL